MYTLTDSPRALIVDDDRNSLGEVALRILRLRIDVFYAKDYGEAWLLARQEAPHIRSLLFPPSVDIEQIRSIVEGLENAAPDVPRSLIVIGPRPSQEIRDQLRAGGVEWALWEPYDESALRSVVSSSMGPPYEVDPRKEARLPTTLLGRVFVGTRRRDAIVSTLSMLGAFLETPTPLPEETRVTLEMALPDGSLVVKARVVYSHFPTSASPPAHPYGMGVEFGSLSPTDSTRLREFLKKIESQFYV